MNTVGLIVLLAQTCVAEVSFQKDVTECLIMWEVNARQAKAHGRTLSQQTKLFNAYWRSKRQQKRRPWIKDLNAALERPKHWPRHLKWKNHRDIWVIYLLAAFDFLHLPMDPICPRAVDYGAPGEIPRGPYVREWCGKGLKQWYWRHRRRRCGETTGCS